MKNRYFRTSIKHAADGIAYAVRAERNFRIDTACAMYVVWFASAYGLSRTEWAVILIAVGMVLFAELINTALERAVDAFSEDYSEAAKNAKDSAAGAVLICALGAAAAGIAVLFDAVRLRAAFDTIFASVPRLVIFAAITVFAVPFVFMSGKKKDDRKG